VIAEDQRRLRRQRRRVARGPLYDLLQAAFLHATRPLVGAPFGAEVLDRVRSAVAAEVRRLAELGALSYFGIASAFDLGPPEIVIVPIGDEGGVSLDADPLIEQILAGGRRGAGWLHPGRLTVDDLAR